MTNEDAKKILIELASETEKGHPIDWNKIGLTRDSVYSLLADKVLNFYNEKTSKMSKDEQVVFLLATVLHFMVITFIDEVVRLKESDDLK